MSESYLIPVRNEAGAAITGKSKTDLNLTYYVDGVDTATTPITVTEVGVSGDYLVTVPSPADDEDHVLVLEDAGTLGVPTGWVYTIKYKWDGDIEKFKYRFVVCGYSQRQGIDNDRAFSSILRVTTFRCIYACDAG